MRDGDQRPSDARLSKLVEHTYEKLAAERTDSERHSLDHGRFEEVLGSLSRRLSDPDALIRTVSDLLAVPDDPYLDQHRTILRLSRDLNNRISVVTTNFDTLLERAAATTLSETLLRHISFAGQALPVPGSASFSGIIHIHGRLQDAHLDLEKERDPEEASRGWGTLGVTPLPYCKLNPRTEAKDHFVLWRDLEALADVADHPKRSRQDRVRKILERPSTEADSDARRELLWLFAGNHGLWQVAIDTIVDSKWFLVLEDNSLWSREEATWVVSDELIEELCASTDRASRIADLATAQLQSALELEADISLIVDDYDHNDIAIPSIEPHQQNENHGGLNHLIRVLVHTLPSATTSNRDRSRNLATRWMGLPGRVGLRLCLHATRSTTLFHADEAIEALLALSDSDFWRIGREVALLLRDRSGAASPKTVRDVEERILKSGDVYYARYELEHDEIDWRPHASGSATTVGVQRSRGPTHSGRSSRMSGQRSGVSAMCLRRMNS